MYLRLSSLVKYSDQHSGKSFKDSDGHEYTWKEGKTDRTLEVSSVVLLNVVLMNAYGYYTSSTAKTNQNRLPGSSAPSATIEALLP
jgi:hypothetical protein